MQAVAIPFPPPAALPMQAAPILTPLLQCAMCLLGQEQEAKGEKRMGSPVALAVAAAKVIGGAAAEEELGGGGRCTLTLCRLHAAHASWTALH